MAILSELVVRITGNSSQLTKAMDKAQTRADKFKRGVGGALKSLGKVAALGLAGIGVAVLGGVAALGGLIKKMSDTEKELRPMIERSHLSAEGLQSLAEAAKRAGSEDGLEGVTDASQELQLQLGELALTGSTRAVEALDAIGLAAADLQKMEPEAAFRAVLEKLQEIPNAADRAIAAEEIYGGSSEKLAGLVNLTAAEFAALEDNVRATQTSSVAKHWTLLRSSMGT